MYTMGVDIVAELDLVVLRKGRAALVLPTEDRPGRVRVRHLFEDGAMLEHELPVTPNAPAPEEIARGHLILLVGSSCAEIATAIVAGEPFGWVPVALSDPAEDRRLGYSLGVGWYRSGGASPTDVLRGAR